MNDLLARKYSALKVSDLSDYLRVNKEAINQVNEEKTYLYNIDRIEFSNTMKGSATQDGLNAKLFNQTVGFMQARMEAMEEQQQIVEMIDESLERLQSGDFDLSVKKKYLERIDDYVEQFQNNQSKKTFQGTPLLQNHYQDMKFLLDSRGRSETYKMAPVETRGFALDTTIEIDFKYFWSSESDESRSLEVSIPGEESINVDFNSLESGGLQKVVEAIRAAGDDQYSADYTVKFEPFDGKIQVEPGVTPEAFYINGVQISQIEIERGDETGSLRQSINALENETGVRIDINENGSISFLSQTGRSIEIAGDLLSLASLNILNQDDFPETKINAKAIFLEGATLSEYEYTFGGNTKVNSVHINEYDGDDGNYNVYILEGEKEKLVGKELLASGNRVSKSNFMKFETTKGDGLVIRPLDDQKREGMNEGLGGWWRINKVDVQWTPDKVTYIGKLELGKPSDIQVLKIDEQWGISEKTEQYKIEDLLYLDLNDEKNLSVVRNYLEELAQTLNQNIINDQRQLNEIKSIYVPRQDIMRGGRENDFENVEKSRWKEFGELLVSSHQNIERDIFELLFDGSAFNSTLPGHLTGLSRASEREVNLRITEV